MSDKGNLRCIKQAELKQTNVSEPLKNASGAAPDVERLFAERRISNTMKLFSKLKVSVVILSAIAILCIFRPTLSARAAGDSTNRIVVMISVDGLAAFYFDDPQAEMPTIRELAAHGARSAMMKASTPTVTWPNHTTLVTGVNPAKHGVVGNNYFNRRTGKSVTLISDPVFDKDEIVKTPTLYDLAHDSGLKTASIRWPATRNARKLDWTLPDMRNAELVRKYATPALLTECDLAGLQLAPDYDSHTSTDDVCTRIFNYILHTHHPGFALLHVINVDHTQHAKGPRTPEAYAAIKEADQQVREVWDELQKDFPERATLIIVSDHGFSPIQHTLFPNIVLNQAKLLTAPDNKTPADVQAVIQGGAAMLYVRDQNHRAEILSRICQAFSGLSGVEKIIGPEQLKDYGVADPQADPHAPDMIVFANEGWSFGDTSAGTVPFKDKKELTGTHGHDPNLAHLHAMFVAWGVGIKPGVQIGEISNTSVAPTIAQLLNLHLPDADGQPLADILSK